MDTSARFVRMKIRLRALSRLFLLLLLAGCTASGLAGEVKLETPEGRVLDASLETAADWPDGPVVLLVHGTLAHNRMELMAVLQSLLLEHGISSLAVNLSLGMDDRHGPYDCDRVHRHLHEEAVEEIGLWVNWLKSRGVRDIVLLGHSRGGNQVAWHAAEGADPAVRRLVLVAPMTWDPETAVAAYRERFGKPLPVLLEKARELVSRGRGEAVIANVDFLYCRGTSATARAILSYYGNDPRKDTPRLLERIHLPVLVFAGSEDPLSRKLVPRLRPLAEEGRIRLVVMEGADHFFRDLHAEELVEQVAEFVRP